jgi:hypothetical protein
MTGPVGQATSTVEGEIMELVRAPTDRICRLTDQPCDICASSQLRCYLGANPRGPFSEPECHICNPQAPPPGPPPNNRSTGDLKEVLAKLDVIEEKLDAIEEKLDVIQEKLDVIEERLHDILTAFSHCTPPHRSIHHC